MPYKDPQQRKAYQRAYSKKRKGGLSEKYATFQTRIDTAHDLKELLESVIDEIQVSNLDTERKARLLLKAIDSGIKLIEVTSIETRLAALEQGNAECEPEWCRA